MHAEIKDFCKELYKQGEYIYPETIAEKCNMSKKNVVEALDTLCSEGLLKKMAYLVCPQCNAPATIYYPENVPFPEGVFCIRCNKHLRSSDFQADYAYKRGSDESYSNS